MAISKYKTRQTLIDTGFNQISGNTLTLCGDNLIASSGTFKYSTCQHGTYTARSVVDADFVTGLTSSIKCVGSNEQVIYRGVNGISGATDFTYDTLSGVTVPILSISTTPSTDLSAEWLLSWDSGTSQVKKVVYSTSVGLTSAINGLGTISDCACLGGLLTNDTTICGNDIHSLNLRGLCNACIITTANNIVLDSRNNTGGVYLKSQCGAIASPVTNFTCSVGISIDYTTANGFKIHDNRTGAAQSGVEYAGNYSTFYSSRSLVDKEYVDAIASGLFPHAAVDIATISPVVLSGTSQTIDGIPVATVVSQGNRILVKNQVDPKTNGIYSASTGTWGRTSDFDESSETVHGAYTFVLSGTSNNNTQWVLSTPNPITLGVTNLTFTVFSQVTNIVAGQGITVTKLFGQNTVSLGGTLTGTTTINGGQSLNINQNTVNLTGTTAVRITGASVCLGGTVVLSNVPAAGSATDSVLVRDTSTGQIQAISNSSIGDKNNIYSHSAVTTSVALNTGSSYVILANSPSASITITLPATPRDGQVFKIKDAGGAAFTNNIIINGNGNNIDGAACGLINTSYGALELMYETTLDAWFSLAFIS